MALNVPDGAKRKATRALAEAHSCEGEKRRGLIGIALFNLCPELANDQLEKAIDSLEHLRGKDLEQAAINHAARRAA